MAQETPEHHGQGQSAHEPGGASKRSSHCVEFLVSLNGLEPSQSVFGCADGFPTKRLPRCDIVGDPG